MKRTIQTILERFRKISKKPQNLSATKKAARQKEAKKTLEGVRLREKAADASQESQGEVCCEMQFVLLGKMIPKRNPLSESHVNGSFTEDRGAWEKEFQRHCYELSRC